MTTRYHYNINLPFTFNPTKLDGSIDQRFFEKKINSARVMEENPELTEWLQQKNLYVETTRCFRSEPFQRYNKHVDTNPNEYHALGDKANKVKLNFVYNSTGTTMKWYKLKDGKTGISYENQVGEPVIGFPDDTVIEIYRAQVDQNCILDGGTIHDLQNGRNNKNYRLCYSLTLQSWSPEPFTWDSAIKVFAPYIF
jgi:hypothetical protein